MTITADCTDVVPFPASAADARGDRTHARPDPAARAEDAALRGRADRDRAVPPLGLEFPGHCSRRSICSRRSSRLRSSAAVSSAARHIATGSRDAGRTRAALFLESSHYVGVAPVPLAQYQAYMHAYRAAAPRVATQDESAGLLPPRHQRARPRPARAGDQRRPFDVRLRPARQRQDGHLAGDSQPARRGHRDPARARGRRAASSGCSIRSITRSIATDEDDDTASTTRRPRRSALGALPPADGDGRRRADARVARTELQPDDRLLPRAGAGGRQRRRAGHRRLRPAARARRAIC